MRTCLGALLLLAAGLSAQTTSPAPAACPAGSGNTPYSYFASTGLGYDQFAKLPSMSTGFGVKTGVCSNSFLVTTITTGIGGNNPAPGYGILSEKFEYHLMHSAYWEFMADGQVGVVQQSTPSGGTTSTVTTALFGTGGAVGFDLGWFASRGKFHLPIVLHADYVAAPAAPVSNAVKPTYLLDFRKVF